jgi:thiamine-monophosphate kinase
MREDGEFALISRLAESLARAGASPGSRGGAAARGAQPPSAPLRGAFPSTEIRVGVGDDAAVTVPAGATVTSTDAFVEGVHFRRDIAPPRSIGRKALAAALSDLAAMGASPGEAYVALGIPEDVDEDFCLELYEGLGAIAAETDTAVLGGDVTRSPALLLAVTVVGHARSAGEVVGRDGAAPDQALAVTGELGGAAAGLLILERPELASSLDADAAAALRERQLEPGPRIAAGAALASVGAVAMIDISDGVGADAAQVAAASGVRVEIELATVPTQAGVAEVAAAAELDPCDLAAAGGEDYELLAVIPADLVDDAAAAASAAGAPLTVIGRTTRGEGVELRDPDGSVRPPSGFDHLRRPPARGGRV